MRAQRRKACKRGPSWTVDPEQVDTPGLLEFARGGALAILDNRIVFFFREISERLGVSAVRARGNASSDGRVIWSSC